MSRFSLSSTLIDDLYVIERFQIGDNRGSLTRFFCSHDLSVAGWNAPIQQINHTFTAKRGTIRGMHFQHPPHCEKKLISCLKGEIFDVAVDLRENSTTFLHYFGIKLTSENNTSLLIPEGFAHGFQTLCDDVELLYFHSTAFESTAEGGIHPFEPKVGIQWPIGSNILSTRDANHPFINNDFKGVSP